MPFSQKTVAVTTQSSILLWPFFKDIRSLCIQNQSTNTVILNFAATPTTTFGFLLPAGELFMPNIPPRSEIKVIGTVNASTFQTIYTYVDY